MLLSGKAEWMSSSLNIGLLELNFYSQPIKLSLREIDVNSAVNLFSNYKLRTKLSLNSFPVVVSLGRRRLFLCWNVRIILGRTLSPFSKLVPVLTHFCSFWFQLKNPILDANIIANLFDTTVEILICSRR